MQCILTVALCGLLEQLVILFKNLHFTVFSSFYKDYTLFNILKIYLRNNAKQLLSIIGSMKTIANEKNYHYKI